MNRALFLDRDGVINEDYGYVHKIEDFHFREGIFDVCHAAQKARKKIIVVTNQAGIGRGLYGIDDFNTLTDYMLCQFEDHQITISAVYHCPYHPTHGIGNYKKQSYDRKPAPGMLLRACRDFDINPRLSVMIGDKPSDRQAAFQAGVRTYIDATSPCWTLHSIKAIHE
jgi:D-glycero-D-manno-heptose 1,7-bisphosphate phosphatase